MTQGTSTAGQTEAYPGHAGVDEVLLESLTLAVPAAELSPPVPMREGSHP